MRRRKIRRAGTTFHTSELVQRLVAIEPHSTELNEPPEVV